MTLSRSYAAVALAAILAVSLGSFAQAPAAKPQQGQKTAPGTPPATNPVPQAPPTGIQTLPMPSTRDAVGPEEVVLTIGTEKITRARFELIKRGLPPQYVGAPQQMGEKGFANSYGMFRGLALLAEREKLEQSSEFKEQLNFLRIELLARLAISTLQMKTQSVTEEEVKAYHAANGAEFQQAQVKAIYVALNPTAQAAPAASPGAPAPKSDPPKSRSDQEARKLALELRQKILAGGDFAALAKAQSDHQASAEKGGELGNIRRNQLPPNLDKVVFSLKPKEVSEPVKEGQGYYIFQVEQYRPVSLDEATATIRSTLQQKKFTDALEVVKKEFPVVLNEKFFVEAQAPAGGGQRPVITGVAPASPGAAGAPAPASGAKPAPASKPEKKEEKKP